MTCGVVHTFNNSTSTDLVSSMIYCLLWTLMKQSILFAVRFFCFLVFVCLVNSVPFKLIFVGDFVIFLGTCRLISVLSIVKHAKVSKILSTSQLTVKC